MSKKKNERTPLLPSSMKNSSYDTASSISTPQTELPYPQLNMMKLEAEEKMIKEAFASDPLNAARAILVAIDGSQAHFDELEQKSLAGEKVSYAAYSKRCVSFDDLNEETQYSLAALFEKLHLKAGEIFSAYLKEDSLRLVSGDFADPLFLCEEALTAVPDYDQASIQKLTKAFDGLSTSSDRHVKHFNKKTMTSLMHVLVEGANLSFDHALRHVLRRSDTVVSASTHPAALYGSRSPVVVVTSTTYPLP